MKNSKETKLLVEYWDGSSETYVFPKTMLISALLENINRPTLVKKVSLYK